MFKVLLIDDERTASHLLKMSLELDGFKVQVCPSLDHARKVLNEEFNFVIIDYNLPQKQTGTTLLEEIRRGEHPIPADIPVIITSGDDRCEPLAMRANASLFLPKPFSPSELSDHLIRLAQQNG